MTLGFGSDLIPTNPPTGHEVRQTEVIQDSTINLRLMVPQWIREQIQQLPNTVTAPEKLDFSEYLFLTPEMKESVHQKVAAQRDYLSSIFASLRSIKARYKYDYQRTIRNNGTHEFVGRDGKVAWERVDDILDAEPQYNELRRVMEYVESKINFLNDTLGFCRGFRTS